MKTLAIIALGAALLFSSCSVTEELALSKKQENTSATLLLVQDFFIDCLNDYEEFADPANPSHAMDQAVDDFATSLQRSGGAHQVVFFKIDDKIYQGTFSFDDISTLIADLGAKKDQTLLTLKDNTLNFHLDQSNYTELTTIVPFLKNENFEPFGPTYNNGMSEADYYDMVSFMLGENAPEAIKTSSVVLFIKTPKPITSVVNGTKLDDTTFRFTFPLIDFLLLNKPIECSVSWQ